MQLYFKQRFFSWFDSYDIYDEAGNTRYVVRGQLSWGHRLAIYDQNDQKLGTVRQRIFTILPKFEMLDADGALRGCIRRRFTLFTPSYDIDCNGWHVKGDFFEWDYQITSASGVVATISKRLFHLTDTYQIDVRKSANALDVLMLVLAIDAEKCSRRKH